MLESRCYFLKNSEIRGIVLLLSLSRLQTTINMKTSLLAFPSSKFTRLRSLRADLRPWKCPECKKSPFQRRYAHTPADDPYFQSIVDNPPMLVKSGQKHGPGLIVLCRHPGPAYACFLSDKTQYSSQPSHLASGHGRSLGLGGKQT